MIKNEKMADKCDFRKGEVIILNKPLEWTSFDLVNKVRYMLKKKYNIKKIKVGHAGTLDPLATGLMILCTGKKTKEIEKYQAAHKEYIATLKFGAVTPSFDAETEENYFFETNHITKELIESKLKEFTGEIMQRPPIFSAKKINGQRAYQLARKGEEIEVRKNPVHVFSIDIISDWSTFPELKLRIKCGKGTYIRSIANDLGKAVNSGAYLTALKRTGIGDYKLEQAETIEKLQKRIDELEIENT